MPDFGDQAFLDAAQSKQVVTYLDLVAATVLAYDYVLTIGDEVRFMWFTPLSLGKALYFLTRYPVIVDTTLVLYHQFAVLSPARCDVIYKTIGYLLGVGTLIAESILVMRTWVIWNRRPYLGLALVSGLVICWIPVFYFLAQSLNSLVFADAPDPTLPGCFLHSQKNILFVVFIVITSFETVILLLTLIKFMPTWRRKKTALIRVIYRDGIFNYVYLCILSICNVVVLFTAPHGYTTLLSALQRVLHSILSSRVLLNLRQAAAAPPSLDTITDGTGYDGNQSQVLFQPWATWFPTTEAEGEVTRDVPLRIMHPPHSMDGDDDDSEGTSRRKYSRPFAG